MRKNKGATACLGQVDSHLDFHQLIRETAVRLIAQKLLLLHSRDRRFQKLRQDVKELPEELARMEKKIAVEKESVALALAEWKGLESENNSLEKEILSMNESINRQRNKQLEVKKNEEYQALENEISNL